MLSQFKNKLFSDRNISKVLMIFVNHEIRGIGRIYDLQIDSQGGHIDMMLILEGESESIGVSIDRYSFEKDEQRQYFIVKEFSSSKIWMDTLISKFLYNRRIEFPPKVVAALKLTGIIETDSIE